MSGASDGKNLSVSSHGYWLDEDGVNWRKWACRLRNDRVCFLLLHWESRSVDALVAFSYMREFFE